MPWRKFPGSSVWRKALHIIGKMSDSCVPRCVVLHGLDASVQNALGECDVGHVCNAHTCMILHASISARTAQILAHNTSVHWWIQLSAKMTTFYCSTHRKDMPVFWTENHIILLSPSLAPHVYMSIHRSVCEHINICLVSVDHINICLVSVDHKWITSIWQDAGRCTHNNTHQCASCEWLRLYSWRKTMMCGISKYHARIRADVNVHNSTCLQKKTANVPDSKAWLRDVCHVSCRRRLLHLHPNGPYPCSNKDSADDKQVKHVCMHTSRLSRKWWEMSCISICTTTRISPVNPAYIDVFPEQFDPWDWLRFAELAESRVSNPLFSLRAMVERCHNHLYMYEYVMCVCVCVCTYRHICIHVYMYACIFHVCMDMYIYTYIYICIYMYAILMRACVHVFICANVQ